MEARTARGVFAAFAGPPLGGRRGGGLKIRRVSRSLNYLLHIMKRIGDAGAGFRSVTERIDITTPAGQMMVSDLR